MFFRKFFAKDYGWYKDRGDAYLAEGRFADARHAYEEAMERLPEGAVGDDQRAHLRSRLAEAGNGLAELNIAEARLYLNQENPDKAREYLELAHQLAEDGVVREKAENLMSELASPQAVVPVKNSHGHHGCSGCQTPSHQDAPETMDASL